MTIPISSGGGKDLGDVVQTEATTLPDGKALLPMDGTLLDAVTYPQLAAVYGNKYFTERNSAATNNNGNQQMAATSNGLDMITVNTQASGSSIISSLDDLQTTGIAIFTNSATEEGRLATMSDDGQWIGILVKGSNQPVLKYSTDGGSTFNSTVVAAVTGFASANPPRAQYPVDMRCNSDASEILVMFRSSPEIVVYRSTDFGVSFSPYWTTTVSPTASGNSTARISQDLSTAVFFYPNPASTNSTDGAILRDGVEIDLGGKFPNSNVSTADHYLGLSADGSRMVYNTKQPSGYGSYARQNFYWYSDDDGNTWTKKLVELGTLLDDAVGFASSGNLVISWFVSDPQISAHNKDYFYWLVGGDVNNLEIGYRLIRVHIPSGRAEVVSNLQGFNSPYPSTDFDDLFFRLEYKNGKECITLGDGTSAGTPQVQLTIDYGQYLVNEQNIPNLKIVADAP